MNVLALKHLRKKAKQTEQEKAAEELLERAYKGIPTPTTPAGEIAALQRYMRNLEKLKAEIIRNHGQNSHYQSALYWVNKELDGCASEIVLKQIEQLQADRLNI